MELEDFAKRHKEYLSPDVVIVFTQMWLDLENFSPEIYGAPNFIFLNVENLTEQKRMDHIMQFVIRGVKIADYSVANIHVIKTYAERTTSRLRHLFITSLINIIKKKTCFWRTANVNINMMWV